MPHINDWLDHFPPEKRIITGRPYAIVKRLMDVTIVLLTSPVWIPIILIISVLIKLESPKDPAFFIQQRTGKGGKRFGMYKFRTMVPNAEELKVLYAASNQLIWPDFKMANDPRVTNLGRILRKTSLDEIPQVINILLGDMSLVGPRPTSFSAETYRLWHTERLDTIPGLTGLWQIYGRGATEFDDRLRMDIAYIERQSIWFDLNILIQTVLAVIKQRGAY
jgi:lipopolysaccharide/colanic/teichoic acid biosynthesis glycosyltransferase